MLSNKEIGLRISSAREMRGLTLDDIATAVGVARSTIQRYEKGSITKIKLPVLQAIAGALNVNPNWLIGNTDDPTPVGDPPSVSDEDIKFALFGGKVSDEAFEEVKRFAAFVKQKEQEKGN